MIYKRRQSRNPTYKDFVSYHLGSPFGQFFSGKAYLTQNSGSTDTDTHTDSKSNQYNTDLLAIILIMIPIIGIGCIG